MNPLVFKCGSNVSRQLLLVDVYTAQSVTAMIVKHWCALHTEECTCPLALEPSWWTGRILGMSCHSNFAAWTLKHSWHQTIATPAITALVKTALFKLPQSWPLHYKNFRYERFCHDHSVITTTTRVWNHAIFFWDFRIENCQCLDRITLEFQGSSCMWLQESRWFRFQEFSTTTESCWDQPCDIRGLRVQRANHYNINCHTQ